MSKKRKQVKVTRIKLSRDKLKKEQFMIDRAMGIKSVSIRLEKEIIQKYQQLSDTDGRLPHTLMRVALKQFIEGREK